MSETETTGVTDTGSAETSGSTASTPSQAIKERAFAEMAKADDSSDYVAERRDQKAEARGDDSVETPHRKQERLDRYRRALERARQEGEPSNEPAEVASEPQADRDAEIKRVRADAQFELRANEYIKANPDFVQTVQEVFAVIPPNEVFQDAVRESPFGPEIVHMFAQHPDALEEFNALPPAKALRVMGALEGRIAHEKAAQASAGQGVRQQSKAPPPLRAISGGMSKPSQGLNDLAKKDDLTEYMALRARQRKAAR
jgi:hypothetical protein